MGKDWKGGSIGNERLEQLRGDKGWDNPREADRSPEPRDPNMDRHAIGTNDKK